MVKSISMIIVTQNLKNKNVTNGYLDAGPRIWVKMELMEFFIEGVLCILAISNEKLLSRYMV